MTRVAAAAFRVCENPSIAVMTDATLAPCDTHRNMQQADAAATSARQMRAHTSRHISRPPLAAVGSAPMCTRLVW